VGVVKRSVRPRSSVDGSILVLHISFEKWSPNLGELERRYLPNPQKFPLLWGIWAPYNKGLLAPTSYVPNSVLIGSTVF